MNVKHIHHRSQKCLEVLLIVLMASMALDVLWQIITRFILDDPSTWTEELARFILIWLGSLGAAFGVGEGFHLEMDYFLQKSSPTTRVLLDRIILVLTMLIAAAVFVYGGGRLLLLANELGQISAALSIPMSWVYVSLPLSGVLMLGSCIYHLQYPTEHSLPQEPID
ncbi:TRAP transporter small permease [Coraliomargarita sp. W4R53]